MDLIAVDFAVADNNHDAESVHGLRSLVSSDDFSVDSLELPKEIQLSETPQKQCNHDPCRVEICGLGISVVACSSPEIKALVQPIPPAIQCRHERNVSKLSLFPVNANDGSETTTRRNPKECPALISPDNVRAALDHELSIEYRDQESCPSEGRFVFNNQMSPLSRKSTLHDEETDELVLGLQRTSIGSTRSLCSQRENRDGTIIEQKKSTRKRRSMHRRISYDNLPNMSDVLNHPDFSIR